MSGWTEHAAPRPLPGLVGVTSLPGPSRTPGDVALDLPPCGNTWTPRTCRGFDQRSPVDHQCWTWSGWPHICRCMRCGTTRA